MRASGGVDRGREFGTEQKIDADAGLLFVGELAGLLFARLTQGR